MAFFGYARSQSYKEAYDLFVLAQEEGYIEATNCLGKMYLTGEGLRQDYDKAYHFFQTTAANSHPDGLYWSGHMIESGTAPNTKYWSQQERVTKAKYYYDLAAKQLQPDA